MRPIPLILSGVLAGALATSAAWALLLVGPDEEELDRPDATPASRESSDAVEPFDTGGDQGSRLARIEEQLVRLTEEVEKLRTAGTASARVPVGTRRDASLDEAALAAALERAEQERTARRLEGLTDPQLIAEARRLRRDDPLAALEVLEFLLQRELTPERRVQGLVQLGILHRERDDLAASEQVLRDAVQTGAGTQDGAFAAYHLALTVSARGDVARALEIAESVGRTPGISKWIRLHGEWAAATLTEKTGDIGGARVRYERILVDCGEDEQFAWLVEDVTDRLQSLR